MRANESFYCLSTTPELAGLLEYPRGRDIRTSSLLYRQSLDRIVSKYWKNTGSNDNCLSAQPAPSRELVTEDVS